MGEGLATRPASRLRDFSKAQRHSRLVRFAKLAIPVGSFAAIGIIMLIAYFDPFRHIEGLSVESVGVNGTQVTMQAPKLTGFRNDSRPYEVTASQATQDIRKPNFVELKDLRARIVTDDKGGTARLEAVIGVLDTQKEQMNLRDQVRVRTDAGQTVNLRSAFVDFKAGSVLSEEPVVVSLSNGLIEATGLKVTDNGKVMQFKGRVRATFSNLKTAEGPDPDFETDPPAVSPAAAPAPPARPTSTRP